MTERAKWRPWDWPIKTNEPWAGFANGAIQAVMVWCLLMVTVITIIVWGRLP